MNAAPASERILGAARMIVTGTRYLPGEAVEPGVLAQELGVSMTPVREALHRLVGEGLLASPPGRGFRLHHLDEPGLRDLYTWSLDILDLCQKARNRAGPLQVLAASGEKAYPDRVAQTFAAVAASSGSLEYVVAMADANARTRAIRACEIDVLPDCETELAAIRHAFEHRQPELRTLLAAFHRRRVRAASDILRRRYRPVP